VYNLWNTNKSSRLSNLPARYPIAHTLTNSTMDEEEPPILTAVSSSARQLYLLLRCIAFANKAHVQISDIGMKLAVDEASVMEGT